MRRLLAAIVGSRKQQTSQPAGGAGEGAALLQIAHAHLAAGRLAEAAEALRKSVALDPGSDFAHGLLGVTLARMGDLAGARVEFQRAVDINGSNVDALNNLGNVLKDFGERDRAVASYRRALAIRPALPATLNNLGLTLYEMDRLDEAESAFMDALRLQPSHADALTNLGVLKQSQGNAAAAEHCFRAALDANATAVTARCNLAALLLRSGRPDEAAGHCSIVLASHPAHPDALDVMALFHKQRGDLAEAEALCRAGLARAPWHVSLKITLGTLFNSQGRREDAKACFEEVVARAPTCAAAQYNLATLALLRGDYAEGFERYESRFDAFRVEGAAWSAVRARLARTGRWGGEALDGRRVLVWAEQGFGDAIMMMRYLPMLKQAGASHVTVCCDRALGRLMAATHGVDSVIHDVDAASADAADVQCAMMSLPRAFATRYDAVPAPVRPHLLPALVEHWRTYFAGRRRPRIGICWKGGATLRDDAQRSIPFDRFSALLTDAYDFVSLQKEGGETPPDAGVWVDPIARCGDFMDTAALVHALDAVVSVDTAVAHLAATLGKPVVLLNRHSSEWRWGLAEGPSVWYPSLTIVRQRSPGDWTETLARAGVELRRIIAASS